MNYKSVPNVWFFSASFKAGTGERLPHLTDRRGSAPVKLLRADLGFVVNSVYRFL